MNTKGHDLVFLKVALHLCVIVMIVIIPLNNDLVWHVVLFIALLYSYLTDGDWGSIIITVFKIEKLKS